MGAQINILHAKISQCGENLLTFMYSTYLETASASTTMIMLNAIASMPNSKEIAARIRVNIFIVNLPSTFLINFRFANIC